MSTIKYKQVLSWLFIACSVLLLVSLFAFKDKLTGFSSELMQAQVDPQTVDSEARRIDSAYNYSKNGLPYQFTFLEFGAKGCSACMRMEGVMEEIRTAFPNRVNVNFINVRLPENQKIMKYFGVVVIPTQILLDKNGKEYFRHTGYFSAEDLSKHF